jgi:hypothetical protein
MRKQYQSTGGAVQRLPTTYKSEVEHRIAGGQLLDHQRVASFEHGQVGVLLSRCLQVFHERPGRLTKSDSARCCGGDLPKPNADVDLSILTPLEQALLNELDDDPMCRCDRQSGKPSDVRRRQRRIVVLVECLQHSHYAR